MGEEEASSSNKKDWDYPYAQLAKHHGRRVQLPIVDTVLFDQGTPSKWIYSQKGIIHSKNRFKLKQVAEKFVKNALLQPGNKKGLVAVLKLSSGGGGYSYKTLTETDLDELLVKLNDSPDKNNVAALLQYRHYKGSFWTAYQTEYTLTEEGPHFSTTKIYAKKLPPNASETLDEVGNKPELCSLHGAWSPDDLDLETVKVTVPRQQTTFEDISKRVHAFLERVANRQVMSLVVHFTIDSLDDVWVGDIVTVSFGDKPVREKGQKQELTGTHVTKLKCGGDFCDFVIETSSSAKALDNSAPAPTSGAETENGGDCEAKFTVTYRTVHLARLETPFGPGRDTSPEASKKHVFVPVFARGAGKNGKRRVALGAREVEGLEKPMVGEHNSGEGLHLLVLRRFDLKEVYKRTYDTNNHEFESDHMASLLRQYNRDYLCIITSTGQWEAKLTEGLRAALVRVGANDGVLHEIQMSNRRGRPYSLVGIPEMSGIEMSPVNPSDMFAEVSTYLVSHPESKQYVPLGVPAPGKVKVIVNANKNHPTHFYGEVKVCSVCYKVYSSLNNVRAKREEEMKRLMLLRKKKGMEYTPVSAPTENRPNAAPGQVHSHGHVIDHIKDRKNSHGEEPPTRGMSFLGLKDDPSGGSAALDILRKSHFGRIPGQHDELKRADRAMAMKNNAKLKRSGSGSDGGQTGGEVPHQPQDPRDFVSGSRLDSIARGLDDPGDKTSQGTPNSSTPTTTAKRTKKVKSTRTLERDREESEARRALAAVESDYVASLEEGRQSPSLKPSLAKVERNRRKQVRKMLGGETASVEEGKDSNQLYGSPFWMRDMDTSPKGYHMMGDEASHSHSHSHSHSRRSQTPNAHRAVSPDDGGLYRTSRWKRESTPSRRKKSGASKKRAVSAPRSKGRRNSSGGGDRKIEREFVDDGGADGYSDDVEARERRDEALRAGRASTALGNNRDRKEEERAEAERRRRMLHKRINIMERSFVRYPIVRDWTEVNPVLKSKVRLHGSLYIKPKSPGKVM